MASEIHIRLACQRFNFSVQLNERIPLIYTPGQIITEQNKFMRGHGTYEDNGYLKTSVAGLKEEVNKLISIRPLKSRYNGEIGDVVIGRITEVQQKRWKVETCSRLDSILSLSSVNLPGGELRRRSAEDEHMMRKYLQEGDLISAEVQNVYSDGSLSLHTRSLKYGKLSQGVLLKVFPTLIKRSKTRFFNLPIGTSIIFGNNGFIWISLKTNTDTASGFVQNLDEVISRSDREVIGRLRNCILALEHCKMLIYDTSILYAYEESLKYSVAELLMPDAIIDIVILTQQRINMLEKA